ncbi:hypothetical protein [Microcoleus sp. D3_18a_C4]|uniref:hypothetical protein n=1 Tax=Microcoleus sp. D3_18a_C4 TaxID=3055332 RepID=UPI002FCF6525
MQKPEKTRFLDSRARYSETGFLREYFVTQCRNPKKPGFSTHARGTQKPGFCENISLHNAETRKNRVSLVCPPFHVTSEKSVEIIDEDEGTIVRGQLDVLALFQEFWVVVIESKKAAFSLEVGMPQLLAYMLANLNADRPTYGLLMNGADFLFVKLVKRETPQYAFYRKFYLFNPGNDLYSVLSILKRLGELNVGNVG